MRKLAGVFFIVLCTLITIKTACAEMPTVNHKTFLQNKPKIEISTPQISGLANSETQQRINKNLIEDFQHDLNQFNQVYTFTTKSLPDNKTRIIDSFTLICYYDVKLVNSKMFSIIQRSYTYTGGAHGMSYATGKNFDVKNGHLYKLRDLFPNDNYLDNISKIIHKQIIDRNKVKEYSFTYLPNDPNFFLTNEGLFIIFQPYEIAPYSEGFIYFFIPYSQLSDININKILY